MCVDSERRDEVPEGRSGEQSHRVAWAHLPSPSPFPSILASVSSVRRSGQMRNTKQGNDNSRAYRLVKQRIERSPSDGPPPDMPHPRRLDGPHGRDGVERHQEVHLLQADAGVEARGSRDEGRDEEGEELVEGRDSRVVLPEMERGERLMLL